MYITLSEGGVYRWEAILLLTLYAIYVVGMLLARDNNVLNVRCRMVVCNCNVRNRCSWKHVYCILLPLNWPLLGSHNFSHIGQNVSQKGYHIAIIYRQRVSQS